MFFYQSVLTYVLDAQKNSLIENHLHSHRDGSFEYSQHMFWLRNKYIFLVHTLNFRPVYPSDAHIKAAHSDLLKAKCYLLSNRYVALLPSISGQ